MILKQVIGFHINCLAFESMRCLIAEFRSSLIFENMNHYCLFYLLLMFSNIVYNRLDNIYLTVRT